MHRPTTSDDLSRLAALLSPTNIRKTRYVRSKDLFLQVREECAAIEQRKRRKMKPWNGKNEPDFEVETPWDGKE